MYVCGNMNVCVNVENIGKLRNTEEKHTMNKQGLASCDVERPKQI